MRGDCQVGVVGLGPVGAVLANLLGRAGVATAVFERESEIYPLPRAAHFDGETLRVFQTLGLATEIRALSRPGTQGMHFVNAAGETLMVRRASAEPGPHGFQNNWYFHQPELERVLRRALARYPHVKLYLGHEVVAVGQDRDAVRLSAIDRRGRRRDFSCDYLIGCDGARSRVRRAIATPVEDLGLHQPWLCLDLILRRELELPAHTVQLCDPARPMTLVNMSGRRRRWEIMLLPGDEARRMTEAEQVWPMLARWLRPADAELERAAVYTFHALLATRWRAGRLLIAGDAAHQSPPFLGQGMCAGVRDAANLAWKLDRVLNHGADPALLDSYASERLAHTRRFVELAVRVGRLIQITDPDEAAARDRYFAEHGPEIFSFPTPRLGPGWHAGEAEPVGRVFPQPRLDDGRLLDEALGRNFALLGALRPSAAGATRLRRLGAVLLTRPGRATEAWLARQRAAAVLLRPDRYVAGVAADAAGLDGLLEKLCRRYCSGDAHGL